MLRVCTALRCYLGERPLPSVFCLFGDFVVRSGAPHKPRNFYLNGHRGCFIWLVHLFHHRAVDHSFTPLSRPAGPSNSVLTFLSKSSLDVHRLCCEAADEVQHDVSHHAVLPSLHRPPIRFRIHVEVLVFTYRSLQVRRPFTSPVAHSGLLIRWQDVPHTKLKVMEPLKWITPPVYKRSVVSVNAFKKQLKTRFFKLPSCYLVFVVFLKAVFASLTVFMVLILTILRSVKGDTLNICYLLTAPREDHIMTCLEIKD